MCMQVFERAPVEAQYLLTYTYVIEEKDLVEHCYRFGVYAERAMLLRVLNLFTLGLAGKSWRSQEKLAKFDIESLKRAAPNYEEVTRLTAKLRAEISGAEMRALQADKDHAKPEEVKVQMDGEPAEVGAKGESPKADKETPPPRPLMAFWIFNPLRYWYVRMYASLHSFYVTVLPHFPTWPFRPDVPYFRMLTLIEICSFLAVGAIVVLGILVSAQETSCNKAGKACNTCYLTHKRYFDSNEPACGALETSVTKIVGSTMGTYFDAALQKNVTRYNNFTCTANNGFIFPTRR